MRIGVDCQALQTQSSRQRGRGIYTASVLTKLIAQGVGDYHLIFNGALGAADTVFETATRHVVDYVRPVVAPESSLANEYLQRLAYEASNLDLLHVASPQEGMDAVIDCHPGARPYALTCMLFDLIPLVFPEAYLRDRFANEIYRRRLELYRHADLVLAISEHSRSDAIGLLGLSKDRVVNVGAAVDPAFAPCDPVTSAHRLERTKQQLGIRSRFVLCTGGFDFRKNLEGMLAAFGLLPESRKRECQAVIVCALGEREIAAVKQMANRHGVLDSIVLTGYIAQASLIDLYNACDAFVFPSLYEGFGLPVLEAMSCGAPTIASNTSSIPEVVGDAGILVDPADPRAVALAMERLLQSQLLQQELRERALQRSRSFSWDATAKATREAFERARAERRGSVFLSRARKPKIAFFSPLPPQRSGIADYSEELLPHLGKHFDIDVYVGDCAPPPAMASGPTHFFSTPSELGHRRYFSKLFQIGNSPFHAHVYDMLLQYPGISVLHEIWLHDLMHFALIRQRHSFQRYAEELIHAHGAAAEIALEMLVRGEIDDHLMTKLFSFNERVLDASQAVIVHSQSARRELLRGRKPELAARVRRIGQGMSIPTLPSKDQKAALKERFVIPADALVIGTFGIMTESKQLELGLRAFQRLREHGKPCYWIGVGEFLSRPYEASIERLCLELGISDCAAFVGRVSFADFYNYLFVCDIALSLRYPTRGETSSAALRAMSCGTPTVVFDAGSFAELPDEAVVKLQPAHAGDSQLAETLCLLVDDGDRRRDIGLAAREYILHHHSWETTAEHYANFIHEVEETGLGDQSGLHHALAQLAAVTATPPQVEPETLNQFISAFASSEGLGRVLWV